MKLEIAWGIILSDNKNGADTKSFDCLCCPKDGNCNGHDNCGQIYSEAANTIIKSLASDRELLVKRCDSMIGLKK